MFIIITFSYSFWEYYITGSGRLSFVGLDYAMIVVGVDSLSMQ